MSAYTWWSREFKYDREHICSADILNVTHTIDMNTYVQLGTSLRCVVPWCRWRGCNGINKISNNEPSKRGRTNGGEHSGKASGAPFLLFGRPLHLHYVLPAVRQCMFNTVLVTEVSVNIPLLSHEDMLMTVNLSYLDFTGSLDLVYDMSTIESMFTICQHLLLPFFVGLMSVVDILQSIV